VLKNKADQTNKNNKNSQEDDAPNQNWNARDKESHIVLYVLILTLTFLLAWTMT